MQRERLHGLLHPLGSLRRRLLSRILHLLAGAPLISPRRRERFRNSARKRDPSLSGRAAPGVTARAKDRRPPDAEAMRRFGPKFIAQSTFGRQLSAVLSQGMPTELARKLKAGDRRLGKSAARSVRMETRPRVSVIMPTYNRSRTLQPAVASVLEQSYPDLELLVCDDGSTDETPDIVAAMDDRRVRYLRLEKRGAAAARNAGLAQARGEIIAYLDSDNVWHPHYLAHAVMAFAGHPGRSALYANYIDYKVQGDGSVRIKSFARPRFDLEDLLAKNYIDLNTFAHRRELYDLLGGFDERLTRRQDYALIIKYTWLQDPIQLHEIVALYQRNESLNQITAVMKHDTSCIPIIEDAIQSYTRAGLPIPGGSDITRVTVVCWDLDRRDHARAFGVARALSGLHAVRLVCVRFLDLPPEDAAPPFEVAHFQGGEFPDFFDAFRQAVDAVDGDIVYAVGAGLPTFGLALLAAARRGVPVILDDAGADPGSSRLGGRDLGRVPRADGDEPGELDLPQCDAWFRRMDPLAARLPVSITNGGDGPQASCHSLAIRSVVDETIHDPDLYDRARIRRELGVGGSDRVLFFHGVPEEGKRGRHPAQLMRRLGHSGYEVLLAVEHPAPDRSEFGDRIGVHHPRTPAETARLVRAADIVVVWSDPEAPSARDRAQGRIAGALAMGATVISDPGVIPGILAGRPFVRPVPYGAVEALEAVLRSVFAEPERTDAMRDAARRAFLRHFSCNAARATFAIAAHRAVSEAEGLTGVANEFARDFNRFYRSRTGRHGDFLSLDGSAPDHASRKRVDAADPGGFALSDPGGIVIVMPTRDARRAEAAADLLLRRAGLPATLVIAEDTSRIGFAATVNAVLPRLEARYVVYLTDTTFGGFEWLKRAVARLEETGAAVLGFASAEGTPRETEIGMVSLSWLEATFGAYRLGETREQLGILGVAKGANQFVFTTDSVLVETSIRASAEGARQSARGPVLTVDAARPGSFDVVDPDGVAVVMPSIDLVRARATAELLADRAGMPAPVIIAEDSQRRGFIHTLNTIAARLDVKYVVYVAEDAFPGECWLRRAHDRMEETGAGVLAFNCGKWRGRIAAFGMVRMAWVRDLYGGPVLFPGYVARKADNELTVLARARGAFVYAPDCVLVEIDPLKGVAPERSSPDRKLFRRRFADGFDGLADAASLAPLASEYAMDRKRRGNRLPER